MRAAEVFRVDAGSLLRGRVLEKSNKSDSVILIGSFHDDLALFFLEDKFAQQVNGFIAAANVEV